MAIMTAKKFLTTLTPRTLSTEVRSPWKRLANAIIEQAVFDYRKAHRIHSRLVRKIACEIASGRRPADSEKLKLKNTKREIRDLERFFCSKWFSELSDLDGKYLLERLKEEMDI